MDQHSVIYLTLPSMLNVLDMPLFICIECFVLLSISRGTDIQAEIDSLRDLRHRVSLGSASLPSICCYTFHNTHDRFVDPSLI